MAVRRGLLCPRAGSPDLNDGPYQCQESFLIITLPTLPITLQMFGVTWRAWQDGPKSTRLGR